MKKIMLFAIIFFKVFYAGATDFTWANAVDGNWEDPTKWTGGDGTDYPDGTDDTISFPSGTYTITLNDNVSVGKVRDTINSVEATFNLNGKTLDIAQKDKISIIAPYSYSDSLIPYKTPIFKNGTLNISGEGGFILGWTANNNVGGFTLDGTTSNFSVPQSWFGGPVKIILKNGAIWNVPQESYYQMAQRASQKHGFILITGEGTQFNTRDVGATSFVFNGYESGLYVHDKAKADFKRYLSVGGSHLGGGSQDFSTNSFVEVDNAQLSVAKSLIIGGYMYYTFIEHNQQFGPTIRVKGEAPSITVGESIWLYDGVAAKFEYEVPAEGWTQAPIKANTLVVNPRGEGMTYSGTTTNKVSAFSWMINNLNATIPLIELTEPNAEALEEFAANAIVSDFNPDYFYGECIFSVSADGTTLYLTAPSGLKEEKFKTDFTIENVGYSEETAAQTVSVDINALGLMSTSITSASLIYSINADFSNATTLELDVDIFNSLTSPQTISISNLESRCAYYVKLILENDMGYVTEKTITFSTAGGGAQTFTYASSEDGLWENPNSWLLQGVAANSYPAFIDKASFPNTGRYTISFTQNESVSFDSITGNDKHLVFDLNGHTLTITNPASSSEGTVHFTSLETPEEEDLSVGKASLTFANGEIAGRPNFLLYQSGYNISGTLVFSNCVYTGKLLNYGFANGNRVFFESGSKLEFTGNGMELNGRAAKSGYGFILARGKDTALRFMQGNIQWGYNIQGEHNGVYVLDGAKMDINFTLSIAGTYPSTNCFVEVDDGVLSAKGNFYLGGYMNWGTPTATAESKNPTVRIKGPASRLNIEQDFRIFDGTGGKIEYTVCTNGYESTPLTASTLSFVERDNSFPNYGAVRLFIESKAWCKANPKEELTLLKVVTPNKEGLERLILNAFNDEKRALLSVNDEGTEIILTSPEYSGLAIFLK